MTLSSGTVGKEMSDEARRVGEQHSEEVAELLRQIAQLEAANASNHENLAQVWGLWRRRFQLCVG